MPREDIVVPNRELSYEGYFSVGEVLEIVKRFLDERDYTRIERVHEHKRHADGVQIEIKGYHEKNLTDMDMFEFDTFFFFTNVKDVEVVINGEKKKVNSGRASIVFKGILFTDKKQSWWATDKSTGVFKYGPFLHWIADKFIFNEHIKQLRSLGKRDVDDLYNTLVEYFQAEHYRRRS